MAELADILGEETPQQTQEAAPEAEVVTEETGATEVEAEAETTTEATESPSVETPEPAMVPAAVMHGERDRRKSVQQEFETYKKAHPEQEEVRPSVFEDENAAFDSVETRLTQGMTQTLLNEGKGEAVQQHDQETVDAAEAWFVTEAVKSPTLAGQLNGVSLLQQHRKVVELYKADMARIDLAADPVAHDAQVAARAIADYKAELELKEANSEKNVPIPKTLVGDSSKGGLKGSAWSGPTPLNSVIGEGG